MSLRNGAVYAWGLKLFRVGEAILPAAPAAPGKIPVPKAMRAADSPVEVARMVPTLFGFGAIGHESGVERAVPSMPGSEDGQGADGDGYPADCAGQRRTGDPSES